MKKLFARIHLWLSIPSGIVISLLCLSGALLVFETELTHFFQPGKYKAAITEEGRIPLDRLIPLVNSQLPDTVAVSNVQIPISPKLNYRLGLAGQGRNSILVDPYSAEITGSINPYGNDSFYSYVRRLHRWLLFQMKRDGISWGRIITGTATLMMLFVLISGFVIWIPKTLKGLRNRLKIKTRAGRFRFWHDFHLSAGFFASIFLLLMVVTGPTWSFGWYRNGFYKLLGVGATTAVGHGRPESAKANGNGRRERAVGSSKINYAAWDKAATNVLDLNPGVRSISVQNGSASASINLYGNTRASDKYTFDPDTGEIMDVQYYKDLNRSAKMRGWIYSVHVGTWGGIYTRILYFISCLAGAALPITGYYIWVKKRWKRWRKKATNSNIKLTKEPS